jgi:hypothetical protein
MAGGGGGGFMSMVPWNAIIEGNTDTHGHQYGTQTTKKNISQEGVNKIIYDIMSSDSGLAALSSGENGSGGFGSSTKGLMAQDLMVKLAGEIANITAETTTSTSSEMRSEKESPVARGLGTIICTHLMKRGKLDKALWKAGFPYLMNLPTRTVKGYHFWSEPIVAHMEKNPDGWMEKLWTPIVESRYQMVVNKKFGILGAFTIYVLEPFSYMIGYLIGVEDGRYANAH